MTGSNYPALERLIKSRIPLITADISRRMRLLLVPQLYGPTYMVLGATSLAWVFVRYGQSPTLLVGLGFGAAFMLHGLVLQSKASKQGLSIKEISRDPHGFVLNSRKALAKLRPPTRKELAKTLGGAAAAATIGLLLFLGTMAMPSGYFFATIAGIGAFLFATGLVGLVEALYMRKSVLIDVGPSGRLNDLLMNLKPAGEWPEELTPEKLKGLDEGAEAYNRVQVSLTAAGPNDALEKIRPRVSDAADEAMADLLETNATEKIAELNELADHIKGLVAAKEPGKPTTFHRTDTMSELLQELRLEHEARKELESGSEEDDDQHNTA